MRNSRVVILFHSREERAGILKMLSARCIDQYVDVVDSNPAFLQVVLRGPSHVLSESGVKLIEGINVRYIRMCIRYYTQGFLPDAFKGCVNTMKVMQ